MFEIAYCQPFHYNKQEEYQQICQDFVNTVKENSPELLKIHLILHLVKSMCDFGSTSAFNAERIYNVVSLFCRCETLIRARNIYSNRLSPSRDIAKSFSLIQHLRFLCSGGSFDETKMYAYIRL